LAKSALGRLHSGGGSLLSRLYPLIKLLSVDIAKFRIPTSQDVTQSRLPTPLLYEKQLPSFPMLSPLLGCCIQKRPSAQYVSSKNHDQVNPNWSVESRLCKTLNPLINNSGDFRTDKGIFSSV
jgi:hypothetical protein